MRAFPVLLLALFTRSALAGSDSLPPPSSGPKPPATAPTTIPAASGAAAPKAGSGPAAAGTAPGGTAPAAPKGGSASGAGGNAPGGTAPGGAAGTAPGSAPAPGSGSGGGPASISPGAHGVVVRLETGAAKVQTPVVVHLKPTTGAVADVQLKDDGAPPDVQSGDGTWSGTVWNENDTFSVSVSTGKARVEGGVAAWSKADLQRDLSLTLVDGRLDVQASVARALSAPGEGEPPAGGGDAAAGGGPGGGAGGGGAGPGGAGGGKPPPGGFQLDGGGPAKGVGGPVTAVSSDATLYVAIGVCGFALVIIAHLYLSGGSSRASRSGLPPGVTVVPEAGLLGPGTPSLSEGLAQWVVAPQDAHEVLRPLIATMARYHRVVVCAPSRSALPAVPGGPVYLVEPGKPSVLTDAVEGVQDMGAGGVAVLIIGDGLDGAALKAQADALPEGVGGVVLVMQVLMTSLPAVQVEPRAGGWRLRFASGEIDVEEREDGFHRVRAGSGQEPAGE